MAWDDLRYVLAVHRAGSVAGTGRVATAYAYIRESFAALAPLFAGEK